MQLLMLGYSTRSKLRKASTQPTKNQTVDYAGIDVGLRKASTQPTNIIC
jgi:hypothetical protein